MSYPPSGSTYYPVYSVEGYYDEWNAYHKRFKLRVMYNGQYVTAPTYDNLLDAFDVFDTNADGFISLAEWRAWMGLGRVGSSTPTLSTAEYDAAFALLDAGDPHAGNYGANDGKLSFEEMQYVYNIWINL